MGGWKLEIARMAGYISLPIGCFYLFNKPEYFQEILASTKQYYFPNDDKNTVAQYEEFRKAKEREKEAKLLAEIEALRAKKSTSK